MKQALIHRYDDVRDILAVPKFKCSEVYRSSVKVYKFELLIVIPTRATKCKLAVFGDDISGQYPPRFSQNWPGRSGPYNFRVDMANIRFTTIARVERALLDRRLWSTSLTVFPVMVDDTFLEPLDENSLPFDILKVQALQAGGFLGEDFL